MNVLLVQTKRPLRPRLSDKTDKEMPRVCKRGCNPNGMSQLQPYRSGVGKRYRQDAIEAPASCAGVLGAQNANEKPQGDHDDGEPVASGEESRVQCKSEFSVASRVESESELGVTARVKSKSEPGVTARVVYESEASATGRVGGDRRPGETNSNNEQPGVVSTKEENETCAMARVGEE